MVLSKWKNLKIKINKRNDEIENKKALKEFFQERSAIREFDGNQSTVEAELGAIEELLPSLDEKGNLNIPLDTPPKYRWWQNGQSVEATLKELGASEETIKRWDNRKAGGVPKPVRGEDS